ncbi:MAG: HAMP domain-containing histidine kinase [Deltaproteobacteria bacterium]|nr:HAMP domain-containing histidine kinase [Deltaproteobacteria bacterium]MBW1961169.1 HAMP domain-containing histidine kinase [Deltaproteobacteria bacterium]MBW1994355.1 HAMP domain-containing histidine kinase [Deltaproteobacteria bacterium]MBW2150269.1 HAMP domain-containing histidine kinase [Deltaproteobacteria bacterium]
MDSTHREGLEQGVEKRTMQLKKEQQALIDRAMDAGRAQMASMVLHNIGNAITPLSVQLETYLKDRTLQEITDYLSKCYKEISSYFNKAGSSGQPDTRIKEVLSLMDSLIKSLDHFNKERKERLKKNKQAVDHISEILKMQSSYQNSYEIVASVNLNHLIQEAVRIQLQALTRRGIKIQMSLAKDLPNIEIVRGGLMQVVLNILKNAYEAIDAQEGLREKKILLKTFAANGLVGFQVTDSGKGIEPDQLHKMVEYGVSEKGSSGFGLYFCKRFIESNDGKFQITSDGIGKGATVTVILPVTGQNERGKPVRRRAMSKISKPR